MPLHNLASCVNLYRFTIFANPLVGATSQILFEHHLSMMAARSFWAFPRVQLLANLSRSNMKKITSVQLAPKWKMFFRHSSTHLLFLQLSSRINAENWISVRYWFYSFAGLPDFKSDIFVKGRVLLHVGCYIEPSDKCKCSCACFLMPMWQLFCFNFCPTWAEVNRQHTKEEINDQRI